MILLKTAAGFHPTLSVNQQFRDFARRTGHRIREEAISGNGPKDLHLRSLCRFLNEIGKKLPGEKCPYDKDTRNKSVEGGINYLSSETLDNFLMPKLAAKLTPDRRTTLFRTPLSHGIVS
jgi:hypothetical protein